VTSKENCWRLGDRRKRGFASSLHGIRKIYQPNRRNNRRNEMIHSVWERES